MIPPFPRKGWMSETTMWGAQIKVSFSWEKFKREFKNSDGILWTRNRRQHLVEETWCSVLPRTLLELKERIHKEPQAPRTACSNKSEIRIAEYSLIKLDITNCLQLRRWGTEAVCSQGHDVWPKGLFRTPWHKNRLNLQVT